MRTRNITITDDTNKRLEMIVDMLNSKGLETNISQIVREAIFVGLPFVLKSKEIYINEKE